MGVDSKSAEAGVRDDQLAVVRNVRVAGRGGRTDARAAASLKP